MRVQVLRSKIHRARITQTDIEYEGSLAIDLDLMDTAGVLPYEKLLVVNASNGERLETYAIPAPRGSRTFCLNGAAARKGMVGDRVTVMVFASIRMEDATRLTPRVVVLGEGNEVVSPPR
jgi:aspartate 1-decarboxylase